MKRKLNLLLITILFSLLFPNILHAQASCETDNYLCSLTLDCQLPCQKVLTRQGGPGGRGGGTSPLCACKIPNAPGSIPLDGVCQKDIDCAPPGKYCWGEFHSAPLCHEFSRSDTLQERQGKIPIYCSETGEQTTKTTGRLFTAVGCVPINSIQDFLTWFVRWVIGISGGIAFLLLLFGGYQIMTSEGEVEKVKNGKETLTAAITGLILLIFSIFVLRFIGIDILKVFK